jgi:trehalose/maltose hydrolase-like predicted phosphorylase
VSETEAHINNVVPPDEYVDMVNNSVYTNFGAAMALRYAVMACQHLGLPYREEYLKVADAIVIPFDETKGIHPEYDTYNGTGSIKQADVILLHYPLGMPMPEKVRIADLDFYATKADEDGPAMTWSMHAIGYRDSLLMEETAKYFNRSYVQFVRKPFNVWTERVSNDILLSIYYYLCVTNTSMC